MKCVNPLSGIGNLVRFYCDCFKSVPSEFRMKFKNEGIISYNSDNDDDEEEEGDGDDREDNLDTTNNNRNSEESLELM